jgi:hypothetical protein
LGQWELIGRQCIASIQDKSPTTINKQENKTKSRPKGGDRSAVWRNLFEKAVEQQPAIHTPAVQRSQLPQKT